MPHQHTSVQNNLSLRKILENLFLLCVLGIWLYMLASFAQYPNCFNKNFVKKVLQYSFQPKVVKKCIIFQCAPLLFNCGFNTTQKQ